MTSVPRCSGFTMLFSVVSMALLSVTGAVSGDPAGDAKSILAYYARSTGLATVISAADEVPAGLVSGLAKQGLAVHVITGSEKARARLVKELGTSAGSDAVMVEKLALSPLPYLDNFVNLMVVADEKLIGGKGPAMKEIERAVVPGGAIAIRKGGSWTLSRKAWPQGMDDWTHPNYDATDNRVSKDRFVQTPFGYKWIDGMGIPPDRSLGCKGWVVSEGRLFTVSGTEPENLGLVGAKPEMPLEYLTARDAFNGLVLWKQRLGAPLQRGLWSLIKGSALIKVAPIAVDRKAVYAVRGEKLVAFNTATGAQLYECANEYIPWAVRVTGGTVVTAGFGHGTDSANGGIEAFDAATGAKKWKIARSANNMVASSKVLFVQVKKDSPEEDYIFGADLATGKELFRLTGKECGGATPRILSCGEGYLLINKKYAISCLSPENGKVMWQLDSVPYFWGPVIDGQLWIDGGAYDITTGKKVKTLPRLLLGEGMRIDESGSDFGCTAMGMVGNLMLSGRHHRYQRVGSDSLELYYYRGMRAACGPSLVAAQGMLFAPPVNCICTQTSPLGIAALAPVGSDPSPAEFTTAAEVEKGPSFGALEPTSAQRGDWPMFRADAQRSASSEVPSVYNFTPRWETKVLTVQSSGPLDDSRISRTTSRLSAPVCGGGKVFAAVTDRGEIVALDEKTGVESWRYRTGSRVETSPSIHRGACFFGCADGYVYALAVRDGSLMWRTRIAPRQVRMMDHGVMESRWPLYGAVLVYNNTIYTSAGRNSESDGGEVIVALDPATGARKWSRHIDVEQLAKNDVLRVENGRIVWQNIDLDPATGEGDLFKGRVILTQKHDVRSGMWDDSYIANPTSRRVGMIYSVDGVKGWMMAWNDRYIVDAKGALHLRGVDTAKTKGTGEERQRSYFEITSQPVAVVAGAKSALLGYAAASGKPRVDVVAANGKVTASIPLGSGVVHNGIAVTRSGVVVALENGNVAFLGNARLAGQNAGFVRRVNCAGKEYKDAKGVVWSADQPYEPGKWGAVDGSGYDRTPDLAVLGEGNYDGVFRRGMRKNVAGPDSYLYMTERSGMSAYRFAVPNGRYAVILHMAETYYFPTMLLPNGDLSWVHRRFDVSVNGVKVLENFEPMVETKGVSHTPIIKKFETDVADGDITIGFKSIENNSIINAIEVVALQ